MTYAPGGGGQAGGEWSGEDQVARCAAGREQVQHDDLPKESKHWHHQLPRVWQQEQEGDVHAAHKGSVQKRLRPGHFATHTLLLKILHAALALAHGAAQVGVNMVQQLPPRTQRKHECGRRENMLEKSAPSNQHRNDEAARRDNLQQHVIVELTDEGMVPSQHSVDSIKRRHTHEGNKHVHDAEGLHRLGLPSQWNSPQGLA
eukprot:CAMPEP_0177683970 /NCGR_PEP_ID=MMETSP0447-20121125/32142_1 /TAXON_ID=0 /ORGANISM="Stygamoeba regulata, Strain BSH-02190019" /LENGTH=201 /DNA_ID=CAMNT_0019193707 /DNA_START=370 /DNA_END=976 /DNA_ORIENTATION=-